MQAQYSEQTLIKEANALFDQGLYADAMPKYAQLLSLNPTSPELNYKYGATALYGDASKKQEASKYLKFAVNKPGVDALSWYFLGRAYHLNYQFADAVKAYEKYVSLASSKDVDSRNVRLQIETCRNGQNLLSNIKEVVVLDKKQSQTDFFFRLYDLSDIGGKILVTPEELLSSLDKKRNHKSLIHFRGIGTTVYFSSYGKDGKNGLDIYQADVLPDGSFSSPTAIAGGVNTPFDEDYPFLHPDNKTFYFSSKGHNSMGGYDVFKSAFDRNQGVFSKPENLDFAVNTPDDDIFYIADSLNNLANFASARSSKQGEMHVYKVEVKSLPLELTLLKGSFANKIESTNKAAKITVVNAATNQQVDVQYTDPATGDYVISFPKSGKYKFLVEAKNSDMVHSGIVDVPASDGISAYLQEMELIKSSGVEKLLINNLFDQQYGGDIAELMQNLLRQKASLEINFNEVERPVEEEAPVVVDKFALAYNDAGFGAGMSNEKVLEEAEKRVSEYSNTRIELEGYIGASAAQSAASARVAEEEVAKAEKLMAAANAATGEERDRLMFEAAKAKFKANSAITSARNARKLEDKLIAYEKSVSQKYLQARTQVDSLEAAINSGDYEMALYALQREHAVRTSLDKVADRFDPVAEVRTASSTAQNDAGRKMESAMGLREEAEVMQGQWLTKKRQREKVSGKQAEKLDQEIAVLASDIADLRLAATRAFDEAEKLQVKAGNELEQYEILAALRASDLATSGHAPSEPGSYEKLNALESKGKAIEPDRASVSNYISKNPQATSLFEGDKSEMAFKKLYSPEPTSQPELADSGTLTSKSAQSDMTAKSASDRPEPEIAEVGTRSRPEDTQNIAAPVVIPVVETKEIRASQEIDSGAREPELAEIKANDSPSAQQKQKPFEENVTQLQPEDQQAQGPVTTDIESILATPVTDTKSTDQPELPAPGSPDAQKRIQAEQVRIQSSQDWIAIIDESISELEQGIGGDESNEEDVKAQLAQYRQLKMEKQAEVDASNELVAALSVTPAEPAGALARAELDIDTLDASLISRLESRIVDSYVQGGLVASIKGINRGYLSEMASIEMSGQSTPEMAASRIALNETLVAELDKVISKEVYSEINEANALELRRIKTLEIQMDREVLNGSAAFTPRTTEAIEYQELLAGTGSKSNKNQRKADTGISSEIAESLELPYSRDLILPGYEASLGAAINKPSEAEKLKSRIDVNEKFLAAIEPEIAELNKAVKAQEGGVPEALNDRYQLLLLEKANAAEQLESDRSRSLENEVTLLQPATVEGPAADPEYTIPNKDFEAEFIEQVSAIKAKELSKTEELKALAEINLKMNREINREIELLMPALDATLDDAKRDEIQVRVQQLDALAADKLQEADRLETEVDVLESSLADSPEAKLEPARNTSPEPRELSREISPDDLKFSIDQTSDYQLMEYKSLNANIQYSQLQSSMDSANAYRGRAREILDQYNSETNPAERRALYDEFTQISQRITAIDLMANEEISKANQAEIDFYSKAGDELIAKLAASDADEETKAQLSAHGAELDEIQQKLLANRALIENLDPNETANRGALLLEERSLIGQLNGTYTSIAAIESSLTAAVEPVALADTEIPQSAVPVAAEAIEQEVKDKPEIPVSDQSFVAQDAAMDQATFLTNPENSKPISGKVYVTPITQKYLSDISNQELAEMTRRNPELTMSFDLDESGDEAQWVELITAMTPIDGQGLDLLRESPEKLSYISAVLAADTLMVLEKAKATYAQRINASAENQLREADRLKEMVKYQSSAADKEFIAKKAEKLAAEAEVSYQRSSVAAAQAEEIRSARIAQEQRIAFSMRMLDQADLAELNSLVDLPVYNVVQTDFTSDEPLAASSNVRTGRKPEVKEAAPLADVSPKFEEKPKAVAAPIPVEAEPAKETRPMPEANWLAMVEIVAEKKDFSDVKETMFVTVDAPVYSASNPIPIDPEMPSGLIFQVQVGAFRNPIPAEHFGEFAPVMGQKIGNGVTRYRAGIFRRYKEAIEARNGIRAKGYTDAFVVAYLNGEKLTGAQAEQILAQARLAENFSVGDEMAMTAPGPKEDRPVSTSPASNPPADETPAKQQTTAYYDDPEAAEAVQVEVVSGLFYTVQVGVYSKPVKLSGLYNLTNLNSELTASGMIRYTTGRFASVADAGIWKQDAVNAGVTDAFITAYNNGVRIGLQEAASILDEKGSEALSQEVRASTVANPSELREYIILIGQFESEVPQEVANILLERMDLNISSEQVNGNTLRYVSDIFQSLEDAEVHLSKCKNAGLTDASIQEVKNGALKPLTGK